MTLAERKTPNTASLESTPEDARRIAQIQRDALNLIRQLITMGSTAPNSSLMTYLRAIVSVASVGLIIDPSASKRIPSPTVTQERPVKTPPTVLFQEGRQQISPVTKPPVTEDGPQKLEQRVQVPPIDPTPTPTYLQKKDEVPPNLPTEDTVSTREILDLPQYKGVSYHNMWVKIKEGVNTGMIKRFGHGQRTRYGPKEAVLALAAGKFQSKTETNTAQIV